MLKRWTAYVDWALMALVAFMGSRMVQRMDKLESVGQELTIAFKAFTVLQTKDAETLDRLVSKIKEIEAVGHQNEKDLIYLRSRVERGR